MNIFNRRDKVEDELAGRMPRPTLPPVEEQLGDVVRDQFAKRKPEVRTPTVLAAELETNAVAFELAVNDAEAAAQAYCHSYAELQVVVDAKLEAIEAQRKELRKLQASMPKVEKSDETSNIVDAVTGERGSIDAQPSLSQNQSRGKPQLSLADRRPKPLS